MKDCSKRNRKGEVKLINKLLLAYLIGLVVTSTFIFIFSEEKVTYRLFATIITGLTLPLSLIPSIISLMIRKSD
ncbi:GhoT/OrtT family toxin [Escherichia coli]